MSNRKPWTVEPGYCLGILAAAVAITVLFLSFCPILAQQAGEDATGMDPVRTGRLKAISNALGERHGYLYLLIPVIFLLILLLYFLTPPEVRRKINLKPLVSRKYRHKVSPELQGFEPFKSEKSSGADDLGASRPEKR